MLTSYGAVSSVGVSQTYHHNTKHNLVQPNTPHKYDCATFSSLPAGKSSFHMSLVGRLSQEVRTVNTTGDIQELRRAVDAGEYTPDPMAIAGKMLFMVEG